MMICAFITMSWIYFGICASFIDDQKLISRLDTEEDNWTALGIILTLD